MSIIDLFLKIMVATATPFLIILSGFRVNDLIEKAKPGWLYSLLLILTYSSLFALQIVIWWICLGGQL
jgi:hypothetical protein